VPALIDPHFPPLLTGHHCKGDAAPFDAAIAGAKSGTYGAGDLLWTLDGNALRIAVVLEPEVARARCHEMLFVLMVAFGDAFGALSPPEVGLDHEWPDIILVNDACVGKASIAVSENEHDGVPDWMVVALTLRLAPNKDDPEPGYDQQRTTLYDEGCGAIEALDLLETTARHFLVWVHSWEEDGFGPVHATWQGRMAERAELTREYQGREVTGQPIGLDEHGGLLLRCADGTIGLQVAANLRTGQ